MSDEAVYYEEPANPEQFLSHWKARAERAEEALAEVKAGFNAYFDEGDLNALLRTESIINRAQERSR